MSAAASSTSRLANSPASGGGFNRPQVAITIGLELRLPPARASSGRRRCSGWLMAHRSVRGHEEMKASRATHAGWSGWISDTAH